MSRARHDPPRFILLYQSVLSSVLQDLGSLGSLAGLIWANHALGGGSWIVDGLGCFLLILFFHSRSVRVRRLSPRVTRAELCAWLASDEADLALFLERERG